MKRLFIVFDDQDFAEWIEEELADYGRVIRSIDSMDFFIPQWSSLDSAADVIILPEAVITDDASFQKIYQSVRLGSPETVFLLIFHRGKDEFISRIEADGNVCVSFDELDTGLLEARVQSRSAEITQRKNISPSPEQTRPALNITTPRQGANIQETEKKTTREVKEQQQKEEVPSATSQRNDKYLPDPIEETVHVSEDDPYPINDYLHVESAGGEEPQKYLEQSPSGKGKNNRRTMEEQKVKLQKIKERIIIKEKIVTVHVPVHFNSILLSVISLYPRAGATFVTSNFSRMLGENRVPVAVFEPVLQSIGSTYYELMHGETNAPKDWNSWAEQIQKVGYITHEKYWVTHGVNWVPANVNPTPNWSEDQTIQLLMAAKRFPIAICDISSNYHEPQCKKILSMSDEIWIVADGDPVQLNHHLHEIDTLKNEYLGKQMKVIGNKWGSYIKQNEWKDAVLLPTLTQIPDFGNIVLKHAWEGNLAWDDAKIKNLLTIPFKPMARAIMAKEMYALMKKQYGFGAKVRGFFNQIKSLED